MIANIVKIIITLKLFLCKIPKYIGLEVDAIVPIADTIPTPNPLALEGYNSIKYIWKSAK